MVRIDKYPSKAEAYAALARMGTQVVLAGRPLAEVAKAQSDGLTAGNGGQRDWTTKGSLVAEELDRALFGLPIGQLSPILESNSGFHIIRVIERQDAMRTPFADAQERSASRSARSGRRRNTRNTWKRWRGCTPPGRSSTTTPRGRNRYSRRMPRLAKPAPIGAGP